jgi:rhodanese-related sulfurtransferase
MVDLVKNIALLLCIAAVSALLVNGISPHGIPLVGQWDVRQGVVTADTDSSALWMEFEIPDPEAAKRIFDAGGAVFVDVRSRDMFQAGHIPGAVSLPLGEWDTLLDGFVDKTPLDRPIVTYCSGRLCQDSHTAAQQLMDHGYQNVVVFIDGFPGWEENGYPVAAE